MAHTDLPWSCHSQALHCAAQVSRFSPCTGPCSHWQLLLPVLCRAMDSQPMESRWQCQTPPCPAELSGGSLHGLTDTNQMLLCKQDQPLPGEGAGIAGGSELLLQPLLRCGALCAPGQSVPQPCARGVVGLGGTAGAALHCWGRTLTCALLACCC